MAALDGNVSWEKGKVFLSPSSSHRNYYGSNKNITHLNFFSLHWGSQATVSVAMCQSCLVTPFLLKNLACGSGLIKPECFAPPNVEIVLSFLKTFQLGFLQEKAYIHSTEIFFVYISRALLFFSSFPCENVFMPFMCFMWDFRSPLKHFCCGSTGNCYSYDLRSLFVKSFGVVISP